jgi:rod shape determining protein RodA
MFDYFKEYFDFKTFLIVLALTGIGLVSIYSATYDARAGAIFERQVTFAIVGFFIMMGVALLPLRTLQRLSLPLYVVLLAVLVAVLILGKVVAGSKSWFGVGGLGVQPSEMAKVVTVLALGAFLARPTTTLADPKHLFLSLAIAVVPMGLVLAQPDVGTAAIFFVLLLPILYWAGADNFVLAVILSPVLVAAGALLGMAYFLAAIGVSILTLYVWRKNLFTAAVAFAITLTVGLSVQVLVERMPVYQQKRILAFLNPSIDPQGAGYNVLQSKVAIGSGGLLGKGYLRGTQTQLNFIPEQWTDFIFCVPGEEFGFLGASVVLVLFLLLLLHGISVASICRNRFASIASIGIVGILGAHTLINVGMAMGLMPVIGIPLPFLSYGGSFLVASMTMAGLLMNFYANRKEY